MDKRTASDLFSLLKSWIPWRSEPANVSRDFWMPDSSCRVCYDCDTQFTLFNRRHHCRLCGRVFCGKCTENSIPVSSCDSNVSGEEWEKIRVCNYCFKQWEQSKATPHGNEQVSHLDRSTSTSAASIVSTKSSGTVDSSCFTVSSGPYVVGSSHRAQQSHSISLHQASVGETSTYQQGRVVTRGSIDLIPNMGESCRFMVDRSEDEDDDYGVYESNNEKEYPSQLHEYYSGLEFDERSNAEGSHKLHGDTDNTDPKSLSSTPSFQDAFESSGLDGISESGKKNEQDIGDECEAPSSEYTPEDVEMEPVDFENNGLLWLPPEPEDEDEDKGANIFDDDDDDDDEEDDGDAAGEWGYLRSSASFGSGESSNRERSSEDHKKTILNVVDGHFRALVAQLLQVENLPVGDEDGEEGWLDIITSLSWEAANLLKPDMSKSGGMDPGGYLKVKCLASGKRGDSLVVKGVVCKKNVAHRRMTTKIEKPRLLILGGALEYQRISNLLSSFDTLLQQEMDHLKMAVAKIDAHHPNVLLVEKSVSRFAQEYLLAKDISLVLNIKRPLLERIARCTGAEIIPSIDHISQQKLGCCEKFHVERHLEDLGSAGQGGKKLVKTLMYFEDCPKPLGCTILLKGAKGDDLKKVKHVVQYGIFAAYHLALETSFLADEGASLPEFPFNSPITVTLPDKASGIERSISTVPGFSVISSEKYPGPQPSDVPKRSNSVTITELPSSISSASVRKTEFGRSPCLPTVPSSEMALSPTTFCISTSTDFSAPSENAIYIENDNLHKSLYEEKNETHLENSLKLDASVTNNWLSVLDENMSGKDWKPLEDSGQCVVANISSKDCNEIGGNQQDCSEIYPVQQDSSEIAPVQQESSEITPVQQDSISNPTEPGLLKEEFPPTPSDHQSILVSLSSRCVWKGTVCEMSHLFRIKYYGSFDKPLGRFLRDHLFDQSYRCSSCEMPSEAHVHCYTHRQGSLTISVKKLPEILLPGEKEGKVWMWHRCLRCPRISGFPPATRRVVMSDAAWGLSFGKFLELSFSNHAAASRVASCGHSLHRDCLRFYGFGKMVACFRYATIDVHSVYLPPSKLEFNYEYEEWIQKETDEVRERAELLFSEVLNALSQIMVKGFGVGSLGSGMKTLESKHQITELEGMLQKEKMEFEENVLKISNREAKKGQPVTDILDINRLRRQLLFQSYMWDNRLIYAASLDNNSAQNGFGSGVSELEHSILKTESLPKMNAVTNPELDGSSSDTLFFDAKHHENPDGDELSGSTKLLNANYNEAEQYEDSKQELEDHGTLSSSMSICNQSNYMDCGKDVRRVQSEGQITLIKNLSDTLDAAWTGGSHLGTTIIMDNAHALPDSSVADSKMAAISAEGLDLNDHIQGQTWSKISGTNSPAFPTKSPENIEESSSWLGMPFLNFYRSINKNFLASSQKLDTLCEYNPVYISSFRESELQGGARLLLPVGVNDTVFPVYDDEPTSIISYALAMPEYHLQLSDEGERPKDGWDSATSLSSDLLNYQTPGSMEDIGTDPRRSLGALDDAGSSISGSRTPLIVDPLSHTKDFNAKVSFGDDGPLGKVKYFVTCYYAKQFEALRRICCPSELDYMRSLSRCKKWGAQGGKSNVFFAKTFDDRFIIKQVTKTELESFIKVAPAYFKYLSETICTKSPSCLAKILGIYQVTTKHLKGGKESKIDVLVMENLLFGRTVSRLYDLKGSSRSRYNSDSSGNNKVLLDQNLIEAMPTSPIFVGNKAKRLLERAVWNDTSFLASIDVMDYSLLVGVDEEKHELVLGIIDFMRQYTWDKHLETWVKASGILGGPKNASPTVISPKQYKKRFRKAMTTYFLMVPDQWSPPSMAPTQSQSDLCEENSQGGTSVE